MTLDSKYSVENETEQGSGDNSRCKCVDDPENALFRRN